MTGGSGMNHMEYNMKESTVWAIVWTSRLFFGFYENISIKLEKIRSLWYKKSVEVP